MKLLPTGVLIIFLSIIFLGHVDSSIPTVKLLAKGINYLTKPLGYKIREDPSRVEKKSQEYVPFYVRFMPMPIKTYFIQRNKFVKATQKSLVSSLGAGIVGFHLGAASSLALPFGIGAALGAPVGAFTGAKIGTAKGIILSKAIFDGEGIRTGRVAPMVPIIPILVNNYVNSKIMAKKVLAGVNVGLRAAAVAASMAAAPSNRAVATVDRSSKSRTQARRQNASI